MIQKRKKQKLETQDLVKIIEKAKKYKYSKTNPSTQIFQALRIYVNKEISELIYGLIKSFKILPIGGIIAVVTFHSLEDKIVKFFFKNYSDKKNTSRYLPTLNEIKINPASRSAKLRFAIKVKENINFSEMFEKFDHLLKIENLNYKS